MATSEANIATVVEAGLCLGCGTCDLVCKAGAIALKETPGGFLAAQVDPGRCTSCGLCMRACPGMHLARGLIPEGMDPFKGPVLAAYLTQATNPAVLRDAQSGGAVSALLCHLIDTGAIDGALVTTMPCDGSLRPRAAIARTKDEILQARGSKYCPVPLNSALKQAAGLPAQRLAVVGLPCHIHGLRNAQRVCPESIPRVGLTVGLVCVGFLSYHAIDHLVEVSGVRAGEALRLDYRCKARSGWPGDVRVVLKGGPERWVKAAVRHRCKLGFEALPCRVCFDQMNILSDVTAGDPWGIDERKDGVNVVVARTEAGRDALLSAEKAGALTLHPIPPAIVFAGQTVDARQRPDWSAFTAAWGAMGHAVPDFDVQPKWRSDTSGVNQAVYRSRLLHALRLSRAETERKATRIAVRHLRWLQLRSIASRLLRLASPRCIARAVARRAWRWLTKPLVGQRRGGDVSIVVFGAHFTGNLGGPSVLLGTRAVLSRYFPDTRYALLYPGSHITEERETASGHGFEIVPVAHVGKRALVSALFWRLLRVQVGSPSVREMIRTLVHADLVVDVSGIAFTDRFGEDTVLGRIREHTWWLVARLLGRPLVKYTSAFGPCLQRWNRTFTRFYLGECCDLALARDPESFLEIRRVGVTTPAMVCPDTGFLLPSAESEESRRLSGIRARHPIVGISVSHQAESRATSAEAYHCAMVALVRHALDSQSAHVLLIPNEVSTDPAADDTRVAQVVLSRAGDARCEIVDASLLSAEELKGVIGQCELVVAARYHTLIAALSLGIPVLAVSWHHKYVEALRLFAQERNVCDIQACSPASIIELFDRLWRNREAVRAMLRASLPSVLESIYAGAERAAQVAGYNHTPEPSLKRSQGSGVSAEPV